MLTLPSKFKSSIINGTRTSLYPIVRIYKGVTLNDKLEDASEIIRLSIKNTTISGKNYKPLLLNIPNIRSSADVINNKYTISNVDLEISNALYENEYFSDKIQELLNAVVEVYYSANGLNKITDCLLVYTGTIRRYSQSQESIKLDLEDLTEQKLKTKLPVTTMENRSLYPSESIGKPFPMTYGYVDNAACKTDLENNIILDKPNQELVGTWDAPGAIEYDNPAIDENHFLLANGWLSTKTALSVYSDGYMPVPAEQPYKFGSRDQGWNDADKLYEFQNATDTTSPQLNLNEQMFLYESYQLDESGNIVGTGQKGLPARVYRPLERISCFSLVYPSSSVSGIWFPATTAQFVGFYGNLPAHDGGVSNINVQTHGTGPFDNDDQLYYQTYKDAVTDADGSAISWWEPTKVNLESGLANQSGDAVGTWGDIDQYWLETGHDTGEYPVQRLQNDSLNSGINLHCTYRGYAPGNFPTPNGAFVRLILKENVGDFPCVTKVFYMTRNWASENDVWGTQLADVWGSYNNMHLCQQMTRFWVAEGLDANTRPSPSRYYTDWVNESGGGDWEWNYNTDSWLTLCEQPNHEHRFVSSTSGKNQRSYYSQGGGTEWNGENGFNNILLDFNTTNQQNSICWGAGQVYSDGYLNTLHVNANLYNFYLIQDALITDISTREYYYNHKGRADQIGVNVAPITKPQYMLKHILNNELDYSKFIDLPDEDLDDDWLHAFTISNQQIEAKTLFNELFQSSLYIPSFNSKGEFKFIYLDQNITDYESYETINTEHILYYAYELTKLEDVKNQVNVRYKIDYGSNETTKQTDFSIKSNSGAVYETLDILTQQVTPDQQYGINYYKVDDEDSKLEVVTEYIRDDLTAQKLQRRLLMWYANQHLMIKLDLSLNYLHLEAGDVVRFDKLIGNKLAFGYDYTKEFIKNGQLVYPVFLVNKINKSLDKVNVELTQLHHGNIGDHNSGDSISDLIIPNPYMLPSYGPETDYTSDYIRARWDVDEVNPDISRRSITSYISTDTTEDIEYEIYLTKASGDINILGTTINQGDYTYGDGGDNIDAKGFVNSALIDVDSGYGGQITIEKKYEWEYPIYLNFVLVMKLPAANLETVLRFNQVGISPTYIPGDLNGDGIINVLDVVGVAVAIVNEFEGLTSAQYAAIDLNGDGGVNIQDLIILVNIILGVTSGDDDGNEEEEDLDSKIPQSEDTGLGETNYDDDVGDNIIE
jgi:hypothetical protein